MSRKVEIIESEQVYRGFLKLARYQLRHTLFSGEWSGEIVRERLQGLGAASVLLYDPQRDQVALLEHFRIGAYEAGEGAWLLETVGGHIGPGET